MSDTMKKAPPFSLPDQDGKIHTLSDYVGKWIILYFYPKDDTPGCTTEACSFRDGTEEFVKLSAQIIGVSRDSAKSHKKFAEKYHLPFPLLADVDGKVCEVYGVWREKSLFGKKYMGVNRDTFLINPAGEVVKEYRGVDPLAHVTEINNTLSQLRKEKIE